MRGPGHEPSTRSDGGTMCESTPMQLIVASHPSSLLHDTGRNHPERPARYEAVLKGIAGTGLDTKHIDSPEADRAALSLVHTESYIDLIQSFCASGGGALDMDTRAVPASWEAALRSAGGLLALVEEMGDRSDTPGFAVARPPGHHATADRAMGFCLFNNVAVAAALLRERGSRVAILDWDVHHGNGTQDMLASDPGTLYVSLHQQHFYPFEGEIADIDRDDAAAGTTVNIPLMAGTAGDVYLPAWNDLVLPVVSQFEPDWVLVSAGYDAHVDDPLADLRLTSADFGVMASQLAETVPPSRVVVALEGGYDLDALASSAAATVLGLVGETPASTSLTSIPGASEPVERAARAIARHWSI